jgi:serine/threonine protein kinase
MKVINNINFKPKTRVNKCKNIYRGSFSNHPIAVKQLTSKVYRNIDQTFDDLQKVLSLGHPNLLRIFSVEKFESSVYIGEELFDFNLESLVKSQDKKVLKRTSVLKICEEIASGLNFLHCKDFIHNNLHPRNVLISQKTGRAKISDGGLERIYPRMVMKSLKV